ncbi:MAG: putative toxin-antitoxin system toxin component, PIN family [Armatimonadota bacterium]
MRPVVVFDVNILVSAFGWRGAPYRCVQAARQGRVASVTCQEILDLLEEKLRTRLGKSAYDAHRAVSEIKAFSRVVTIPGTLHAVLQDPEDNKVIECALAGGATHIVSGDKRHLLALGSYHGIQIITARALLELIGEVNSVGGTE